MSGLKISIFLISIVCFVKCQNLPDNPCPKIFQYREFQDFFVGEVTVPVDGSNDLILSVNISMTGLYNNVKVTLELLTPTNQITTSSILKYRVYFPFRDIIPRITQITFNGEIICFGPPEPLTPNGVTNLWASLIHKISHYNTGLMKNPFIFNKQTPDTIQEKQETCGVANNIQTLVLKGETTPENEFPWLVAMFHRREVSYEFQCTANLISNRHVITAAHCVWFLKAPLIDKEDILFVIGRSNISRWASTGALIRTALEVKPHPDYTQNTGHCDIAVIKLNEEVTFRRAIRPICLWEAGLSEKVGVVAGWGKTEEKRKVVAEPRKVTMPIVTQEECLRSHSDFIKLTSEMTFCAGRRDGSGPCNGDSGAGFVVEKAGQWFLKGVVSTAVINQDLTCNLNEYFVFADVAKLKQWILQVIK